MRAEAQWGAWLWWGGWLAWPLLAGSLWALWARRGRGPLAGLSGLSALASALFVQARFIEPALLVEREADIRVGGRARIALIADLHLGLYKDERFVERLVDRLNRMHLDAVLIAGDFHGEDDGRPIGARMAPFRSLRHPAYAVSGNHDAFDLGGRARAGNLFQTLRSVKIEPIEGRHVEVAGVRVVGIGDRWAGRDGLAPVTRAPRDKPLVVLMHNPDSAMNLKPDAAALAVAGHTHGGQLRVPGIYRRIIPCEHPFDRGLHTFAPVPVYVTSGLGETAVPLRWLNPPAIDVLALH